MIPAGRLHGAWRMPSFPCTNDTNAAPPPCHFDRSGEISLLHGTSRIGTGDLSSQSFNRVQAHLPPLRHAAPLEMTDATGCLASLEKEGNAVTPHCHFARSGEISLPYAARRLASPAFLPTGIYYHCRHEFHVPRFFTSFRITVPAGRLHSLWRLSPPQ